MTEEEFKNAYIQFLKDFDTWTLSIGLPNDVKPLKDITSEEFKVSLRKFYETLNLDVSFRKWVESFYRKDEIDFDYIDLMSWEDWFKLYINVFVKYKKVMDTSKF